MADSPELLDIEAEARRIAQGMCNHKCHTQGLNPWVETCPICGCPNKDYDPEAECDIFL